MDVRLKGVVSVTAKGRAYYYAWRGGPRLTGEPGSPEFLRSYNEAHENRRAPDTDRFSSVIIRYKGSDDFNNLADSTKRNWRPWLDRIGEHFGNLSIAQFDRPERIRRAIRQWRSEYADRPRTADYGLQVLSRVLSYAVDPLGKIGLNPCEGIKQLYSADRSEIIWLDSDIAQLKATASAEIGFAVDLAAYSGLRLSDLLRLSWSHIGPDAITLTTGKSKHRRQVVIPLYDDLRGVLDRIPRRSTIVLTTQRGTPWTGNGFGSSFNKAKIAADMDDRDLHFHDLRGTASTRFYVAGLTERVIAEIMGWTEESVARIIRRYVDRRAATKAIILQLNKGRGGT